MKVLIFWDVYGRIWRAALKKELPKLKEQYAPDFTIVNLENCTSWRWPIEKHVLEIESFWVDIMTWWDHVFDNMNRIEWYLNKEDSKLIRAANFLEYKDLTLPGKWFTVVEKNWKKLLVIHLIWEVFMHTKVSNPFIKAKEIIDDHSDMHLDGIIIDFHKETTAEWYGLAHFLDGEASFIFGTHTHIQTNDELILPGWTWILSDVWMNGPLYSVIWADYKSVEKRFLSSSKWKIEQSLDKNYVVNGVLVEIGENMKCINIEKIRIRWQI